jgi:putative ABC transport system substrate-binding protein
MRRVGVLMAFDETDPEGKARLSAFTQGLTELGWTDGRNLRMDVRWVAGTVDRMAVMTGPSEPYDRDPYIEAKAEALAALAGLIERILNPPDDGKVVELAQRRG